MSWGGRCSTSWPWMLLEPSQVAYVFNHYDYKPSRAALKTA